MENKKVEDIQELGEFFKLSKDIMIVAKGEYFIFCNESAEKILGYTKQELLGSPFYTFIYPEDRDRARDVNIDITEYTSRSFDNFINRYIKKDGTIVWIEWTVTTKGLLSYAIGRDISERHIQEIKIKEDQDKLNLALEAARFGTWSLNLTNQKINFSDIAKRIYGRDMTEELYVEDFVSRYVYPEDQDEVYKKIVESIEKKLSFNMDFRIMSRRGDVRWISTVGRISEYHGITMLTGVVSDITQKKSQEQHANMLAQVVENSSQFVSVVSLDFKTIFLNPSAKRMIGLKDFNDLLIQDFIGKNFQDKIYKNIIPELRTKQSWSGEVIILNLTTGEKTPVAMSIFPITVVGLEEPMSYGVIAKDITDIKNKEMQKLQDHKRLEALTIDLRSAMDARDTFIALASHELKTPLTSLKLQSQLSKKLVERIGIEKMSAEQIKKMIENPLNQANKLTKLINEILDASVVNSGRLVIKRIPTNLSVVINENLKTFKKQIEDTNSHLTVQIEPDVVGEWDSYRIDQVVTSLVSNALKYAPGEINVSLIKKDDKAIFVIKDKGPGIHPDSQGKVFNRFERAVPYTGVSGLGLGLYLARQIVEAHHGEITLKSEPEQGCEFTVVLPIYKNKRL